MKRRPWSVLRTWWELTKLILAGRGSWDFYLYVDGLSNDAQKELDTANWMPYHLDWIGGGDRYAVLAAEPDITPRPPVEADERMAGLEKQLADERFITARLSADVDRLTKANAVLTRQRDTAVADADRIRRDAVYTEATRCECGGDAELHWRRRAEAAEEQSRRDRANAVAMADRLAKDEGRPVHAAVTA